VICILSFLKKPNSAFSIYCGFVVKHDMPLTDPPHAVPHAHRVMHTCRRSVS